MKLLGCNVLVVSFETWAVFRNSESDPLKLWQPESLGIHNRGALALAVFFDHRSDNRANITPYCLELFGWICRQTQRYLDFFWLVSTMRQFDIAMETSLFIDVDRHLSLVCLLNLVT